MIHRIEIRRFFDDVDAIKWDFKEWNDEYYGDNKVSRYRNSTKKQVN